MSDEPPNTAEVEESDELSEEEKTILQWLAFEANPGKVRVASLQDLKPKLIIRK